MLLIICLLSACDKNKQASPIYQGYAEGDYVRIASPIGGRLLTLSVTRGAQIAKNTPVFVLEHDKEDAALAQALSAFNFSKIQFERQTHLLEKKLTSKEALDAAKAQFEQAQAQVAQLQWQVDQKTVSAPQGGLVIDTFYEAGEQIAANTPVIKLLPPGNIKIRFFVPEDITGHLKIGDEVKAQCDNCSEPITARINYISPQAEFTPPIIYSKDNRTKLVFLIEAKPSVQQTAFLHPGQPLDVDVLP
jgi:HlyD family secretion protein